MANAVTRALTRHAAASADHAHVELRQFAQATEPTEPSSASTAATGLVGARAGGLLGGLARAGRPRPEARPARAAGARTGVGGRQPRTAVTYPRPPLRSRPATPSNWSPTRAPSPSWPRSGSNT